MAQEKGHDYMQQRYVVWFLYPHSTVYGVHRNQLNRQDGQVLIYSNEQFPPLAQLSLCLLCTPSEPPPPSYPLTLDHRMISPHRNCCSSGTFNAQGLKFRLPQCTVQCSSQPQSAHKPLRLSKAMWRGRISGEGMHWAMKKYVEPKKAADKVEVYRNREKSKSEWLSFKSINVPLSRFLKSVSHFVKVMNSSTMSRHFHGLFTQDMNLLLQSRLLLKSFSIGLSFTLFFHLPVIGADLESSGEKKLLSLQDFPRVWIMSVLRWDASAPLLLSLNFYFFWHF